VFFSLLLLPALLFCFAGLFIKKKKKSLGPQGSVLKDWDEMRHDSLCYSLCWVGLHFWTIFLDIKIKDKKTPNNKR